MLKISKILTAALTAAVIGLNACISAFAEGAVSVKKMLEDMPAKHIIVTECTTGTVLFEKESREKCPVSHLAKLMVLLIAAEMLDSGRLDMNEVVTVSANANSKEGAQIWLDKGEKIRVEELIKAITVGNANDACTALAEHIAGDEQTFTSLMNCKAEELGMENTYFADCCGTNLATVSTAEDMAKLAAELVKHEILTPYFTTWLDTVRDVKAELVSQNRLVRTYKGITGMKACGSSETGEMSVVTAERRDMHICVVILGCDSSENREQIAKKLLDESFERFSIYKPEIDADFLEDIPVSGGEERQAKVGLDDLKPVIISKGTSASFDISYEREEMLTAPVKKGSHAGSVKCTYGDETIFECELKTAENIRKMDMKCALKKLMYNMIEMF